MGMKRRYLAVLMGIMVATTSVPAMVYAEDSKTETAADAANDESGEADASGESSDESQENMVLGEVKSVSDSEITIAVGTMKEGQIFIEPQGFCIIAGIGVKEGLAKKALDSVKERLDTKYGIMLHQPAYTRYYLNLGEISSYPPGYKENAGIFCHNNPWISIAETVIGRGNRAFEIYKKTCPSYIENISEIHRTEPYVYSQMIAGRDAARHGEAKNSWLTGTAAWTFVNLSQAILGVQPSYDGLSIDPCVPEGFGDFTLTRRFRGATYYFDVKNPNNAEKGVAYLEVDGKHVNGNVVPVEDGKTEYHVTVHME